MDKKLMYLLCSLVFLAVVAIVVSLKFEVVNEPKNRTNTSVVDNPTNSSLTDTNFDFKIINKINKSSKEENYLISPLSIATALSMVKDAASGNTYDELQNVLGDYNAPKIQNVKDKIGIANSIFINEKFEKDVKKEYKELISNKYNGEVIIDPFTKPDNINKWISEKTFNMINDVLKEVNPNMATMLINALAIDVEWSKQFEEYATQSEDFTLNNGSKMKTAMMHQTDNCSYIESNNAKGIIKNYKTYEGNELEYIAIIPNGNIKDYLNKFNEDELKTLLSSEQKPGSELEIHLSLPKYTYDYTYNDFTNDLKFLGIKKAFTENANFEKMLEKAFISQAIHKTHIELSEAGTKAAAVTIFTFETSALKPKEEKKKIDIKFNKPFIYLIKDKNSDNIWFYGVVYEPMKWEDNKKSE